MAHQVFISFSSADRELAELIHDRLQKRGITAWISSRDIAPGADYQSSIVEAIQQAKLVLLVFSSRSNSSQEVVKELSLASAKLVIPARIEDVMPEGAFKYQISNRQFFDMFDNFDRRMDDLCAYVASALAHDNAATSPPARPSSPSRSASTKKSKVPVLAASAIVVLGVAVSAGWYVLRSNQSASAPQASTSTTASAAPSVAAPVQAAPQLQAGINQVTQATANVPAATPAAAATPAPAPASPSEQAQNFVKLLGNTTDSSRLTAIRNLSARIPQNLSAADAASILNDTNGYRTDAIQTLANSLADNLSGGGAAAILGPLSDSARLSAIKDLTNADKLKQGLTTDEAVTLLQNTNGYRTDAIQTLANSLAGNLSGADAAAILGPLSDSARLSAIKDLASAGKLKQGLTTEGAVTLLQNTNGYRTDAIQTLANSLAGNLSGGGAAAILGPLTDSARLSAIQDLAIAGKFKRGLSADEASQIAQGTNSYSVEAMKKLGQYMK